MSNIFSENGFFNDNGKAKIHSLVNELNKLFSQEEIKKMNFSEIQSLGANLQKIIGDKVSEQIRNIK